MLVNVRFNVQETAVSRTRNNVTVMLKNCYTAKDMCMTDMACTALT